MPVISTKPLLLEEACVTVISLVHSVTSVSLSLVHFLFLSHSLILSLSLSLSPSFSLYLSPIPQLFVYTGASAVIGQSNSSACDV